MNHQQILDKLAAKHLVMAIEENLAHVTFDAMCFHKTSFEKQQQHVLDALMPRWNCVLNGDHSISPIYRNKTALALAVLLHKYGFMVQNLLKLALDAIDGLNREVALSDDFFRKSEPIKQLLKTDPAPLKRKPATADNITFYRAQDLCAIQLCGKYYLAYVHSIHNINSCPIVEFYDAVFDHLPSAEQVNPLLKRKAKGQTYNDGICRTSCYYLNGMTYLPDPANQVHLIQACWTHLPDGSHLHAPVGLGTVSHITQIPKIIDGLGWKR